MVESLKVTTKSEALMRDLIGANIQTRYYQSQCNLTPSLVKTQ